MERGARETLPRRAEASAPELLGDSPAWREVCRALPDPFIVLSGDDALTLPLMSIGGRGIISVASNEMPSEMAQMVEAAEGGDFTTARQIHRKLLPIMQVNFVESNPIPVKAAMAAMGLIEERYRLPLVPPGAAARDRIMKVLQDLKLLGSAALRS